MSGHHCAFLGFMRRGNSGPCQLRPRCPLAPTEEVTAQRPAIRAVVAGGIGSFVEWFDYSIYALFAGYFATQFFPSETAPPPCSQHLASSLWASFARPVGAWFFGRVSDRYGRRQTLVISVILISASSLIIGLCPTAASIGLWAGIVLLLARLLQGSRWAENMRLLRVTSSSRRPAIDEHCSPAPTAR